MKKISILLVDDHAVVRMGLAAIINLRKELQVVAQAETGAEAIRLASEHKPDVVIMDLMMPEMDGAEATARLLEVSPASKVLILTTFGTSADLARALDAGATGAITKNLPVENLIRAIQKTAAGERCLSPEIARTLKAEESVPVLNERQLAVLASITRGLSNDDIATQLGLSRSRIKQHLNELYEKLGAANRTEAVAIALRKQLLKI